VPDDRVSWDVAFPEYSPVCYTADVVASRPPPLWADPDFEYDFYAVLQSRSSD